jgi:2-polyprenyl-6-methoxyphenol hydroxylase-like FAD-dependent oxidoreductase
MPQSHGGFARHLLIESHERFEMSKVKATARRGRAIVIGGSMAGLAAARVLSDHYDEVVVLERDTFADGAEPRRGVPQGRHLHALLVSGVKALESYFPHLLDEGTLVGGLRLDVANDIYRWYEGGEHVRCRSGMQGLSLSRPRLEWLIRERVRGIPNIRLLTDRSVKGVFATPDNRRITSVRTDDGDLWADLVVDAMGRGSRSPQWLEAMGYGPVKEERIEVGITYVTRCFRRSPNDLGGALAAIVASTPEQRESGFMAAQEGDRWMVTLCARSGGQVPTELDPFVEFAGRLPTSHIHDVISRAEPIGDAESFRFPASIRRRYEHMDRFPEGYFVIGDAVSSFNPVYGQGMSVAALEAAELDKVLREGSAALARTFFARIAKIIDTPWSIAAGNDLRISEVAGPRPATVRFLNWYIAKLHVAARRDASLALAFQKVANLISPPNSLFAPRIVVRVLADTLSRHVLRQPLRMAPPARA